MSWRETRLSKIEQLGFLARAEEEREIVIEASKEICDAESEEAACKIADKYRKQIIPEKLTNMVDVIASLLKGGHIDRFTSTVGKANETFYLVFIPVPDPPKKKALVGHITRKQFNELYNKGIISEREHLRHKDDRGNTYEIFQIAEDIILRFRGKNQAKETQDI